MSGLRWSGLSMVALVVLQLVYLAAVSRLLSPAAFGLMAVASLTTEFGKTFAQMGLGQALIQKADLTEEDVRAVFTSSLLMGLAFFAALWFSAPLLAAAVNARDAVPLIRAMGLVLLFTTCGIASQSLLFRQLRFREQAVREIGSYVVGFLLIGVGSALAGAGVWSLVAARVSGTLIATVLGYSAVRHSLRPLLGWRRLRPLYSFGGRTSASGLAGYFTHNLDTMAVSRYTGAALLGQYSKAYRLTSYPSQLMVRSMARVLFPGFSQLQHDRPRLRAAYVESYSVAVVLMLAVCAFIAASSQELVLVLFGQQWDVAARIVPLMMLAAALRVVSHLTGTVFQALGELNKKLAIDCAGVVALVLFLLVARGHGLLAYAAALAGAEAVRQIAFTIALRGVLGMTFGQACRPLVPALFSAAVVGGFTLLGRALGVFLGAPNWITLLVTSVMGGVGFVIMLRLAPLRGVRRHTVHRLRQAGLLSRGALAAPLRWLLGAGAPGDERTSAGSRPRDVAASDAEGDTA